MTHFNFFGMQRSGNHAIIAWLMKNGDPTDQVFFNNCQPGRRVMGTFRQIERDGRRVAVWKRKDDPEIQQVLKRFPDYGETYVSYENTSLSGVFKENFVIAPDMPDAKPVNVYIYRDLLNWLASTWARLDDANDSTSIDVVSEVLARASTWRQNLVLIHDQAFLDTHKIVPVCYDTWFGDSEYRKTILTRLDVEHRDVSLPEVQSYGKGSSFDGMSKRKDAAAMAVHERWKEMLDSESFRLILKVLLMDADMVSSLKKYAPDTLDLMQLEFNLALNTMGSTSRIGGSQLAQEGT